MDTNKNSYTFIFATIMVIIVAALLSITSEYLKEDQKRNKRLEKQQNILQSIDILIDREASGDAYQKFIRKGILLNSKGKDITDSALIQGDSAFGVILKKEIKKDILEQRYPIYIASKSDSIFYIIPVRGKGLWGPIWGYVSLQEDFNTIYGAVFDHEKETPGLGAEINEDFFQDPFKGKMIFKDGELMSVTVKKGRVEKEDKYAVDGISGGTITSDGVTDMLKERLKRYEPYLNQQKNRRDSLLKSQIDSLRNQNNADTTNSK